MHACDLQTSSLFNDIAASIHVPCLHTIGLHLASRHVQCKVDDILLMLRQPCRAWKGAKA
jgi:hypothetical protein